MSLRRLAPWWARVAIKQTLSRIPVDYAFWRRVNVFRHGEMDKADYAWRIFDSRFKAANIEYGPAGFSALELGAGDSLFSALIAAARGATECTLVDVGAFATQDLAPYHEMGKLLKSRGLQVPDISAAKNVQSVLDACNARYLTNGLESLKSLPDASVDFAWSNAVLEHIRLSEFDETMRQLRRIIRPTGACSHQVDLRDHLGGGLNNLRYPEETWESERMAGSGFYTNRIRFREMCGRFEQCGFRVEIEHTDCWDRVPTPRRRMRQEFASLDEADLLVMGFSVVLWPASAPFGAGGYLR